MIEVLGNGKAPVWQAYNLWTGSNGFPGDQSQNWPLYGSKDSSFAYPIPQGYLFRFGFPIWPAGIND